MQINIKVSPELYSRIKTLSNLTGESMSKILSSHINPKIVLDIEKEIINILNNPVKSTKQPNKT